MQSQNQTIGVFTTKLMDTGTPPMELTPPFYLNTSAMADLVVDYTSSSTQKVTEETKIYQIATNNAIVPPGWTRPTVSS